MEKGWNVTYEIITPESAEHGEAEERGFALQDATFRDAWEEWTGWGLGLVEADSYPVTRAYPPRWLTSYEMPNPVTGAVQNSSLHFPDYVTPSSRIRVARLADCYGLR